ncbi:MAG: TonB family protein [candidate division KSB1 bacterium]|nr:TonB family protein [candidate division KSB1 bacterium]
MAKQKQVLHLRIEQDGKVLHRYLQGKDAFYIGKSHKNDVILIGEQFPKRHPLFVRKGDRYVMQLPPMADGEILAKNSRLRYADLIEHDLLPRGKGYFELEIKPGRMGYVFLNSTRIDYVYESKPVPTLDTSAFSPLHVFLKGLKEDLLFKTIAVFLFIINAGMLYALRDYMPEVKIQPIEKATQRLARFVLKAPEPPKPVTTSVASNEPTTEESASTEPKEPKKKESAKKDASPEPKKKVDPANLGVLALLGGTGESSSSNSVVDFLLNKDLATGLGEVTKSRKLTVGKSGTGTGGDEIDELLTSISTGGIDDILGGMDEEVETVSLSKKGEVQIERLGGVSGSEEAVGARNEQSLYEVLRANMGRLTYIYNKYLKRNPDFRGEMRVEVTIAANGRVVDVKLISSTMGNSEFEREILAAIRRFRYDPIASGTVKVVYPILFNRIQ